MKRTLILLSALFMFYLLIQVIFNYVGPGHDITYKVNGYKVHEILTQHQKEDVDSYYFEITKDDIVFNYQIDDFRQGSKLIKKIKYFKNVNYECMVPILRVKGDYVNIVCKKDDVYYNYSDIKGQDPEIDKFASEYDNTRKNTNSTIRKSSNLRVYNNLIENHYLALEYYKGIYVIDAKKGYRRINLFKKEKYSRPLAAVIDNYYVVADYNEEYDFHKFYLVDLTTTEKSFIISNNAISLNSYIQGVIDDSVYLFDKDNQKQYKIDVDELTVTEVGNKDRGIKIYVDGEFKDANVYEATAKELLFNNNNTSNVLADKEYAKVDLVGSKTTGHYYMYEFKDGEYYVYTALARNPKIKKYLFKIKNINQVVYIDGYIYYLDNDKIYAYSNLGNRLILSYKDIIYNQQLKYYAYKD